MDTELQQYISRFFSQSDYVYTSIQILDSHFLFFLETQIQRLQLKSGTLYGLNQTGSHPSSLYCCLLFQLQKKKRENVIIPWIEMFRCLPQIRTAKSMKMWSKYITGEVNST